MRLGGTDPGATVKNVTRAPSQPRIPLVAAIFPEAALALADAVESFDGLDAGQVFGVLVADLALDPQPQRRAVADRQRIAVHAVGQNGLRMQRIEQVEALVIEAAAVGRAHQLVDAIEY